MKLGRQWDRRLEIWDEAFLPNLYRQLGEVELSAFTTMEHIRLEQARGEEFRPFPPGTRWGEKWQYGWVRGRVELPPQARGQRILLHLGAGPEMLVYINGREAGSIDRQHFYVELTPCANPGDTFEVYAEVYAGHGIRPENGGIYARDDVPVPEPPLFQCTVKESHFGVWDQELFAVYADYHTLYGVWKALPQEDLRGMKIGRALQDFTCAADFEAAYPRRRESILRAGEGLKPLLRETNGPTVPEYTVFGQSHIDLAWLWTLEETKRKAARTYSTQLGLMERYPGYRFLLCEPALVENLKRYYPDLYERVREKVRRGQIVADGAVYVESDTNLPQGESLIRQFVLGKRWFRDELGVDSQVAWMPDTFGFSGALPQIMKGCRVSYFATQKLLRSDPESEPFPYNLFWWEGIDGTRVLAHVYKKNNAVFSPEDLVQRWERDRNQKEDIDGLMYPFGYGDGGGGPTELMVESCLRCEDLEGLPRCRMGSPLDFFRRAEKETVENVYYGELYLAWHRGTYSSQARLKRKMRRTEFALRETEYLAGLLRLAGKEDPDLPVEERLEELWKIVLVRQFHDIMPGASIQRVNEEAMEALEQAEAECRSLSRKLLERLADGPAAFNSLSWDRPWRKGMLPGCGYVRLTPEEAGGGQEDEPPADWEPEPAGIPWGQQAPGTMDGAGGEAGGLRWGWTADQKLWVANSRYRACVNSLGQIESLTDPVTEFEYAAGPLNRLRLYRDVNVDYDAWELGRMYQRAEEPLTGRVVLETKASGEGFSVIVNREEEYFSLRQMICFGADTPRIDFRTQVTWRERHRILKADFPTAVFTREVLEEIPFGCIKRPTHRSRRYERDLYETSHHKYAALTDGANGLAVLNDGRYGISAADSRLSLTLLRAPVIPDMNADQGLHCFTYSVMPFRGPFSESGVVQEAYGCNVPVTVAGKGGLGKEAVCFFRLERGRCILETCKPAMDVKNGVVLRLYEPYGQGGTDWLRVPAWVKRAYSCNMLEERDRELSLEEHSLKLTFRPFEILTVLLLL